MPDNTPSAWPPGPPASEAEKIKALANGKAGAVSLGMAVAAGLGTLALPLLVLGAADITLQRLYVLGYMTWWAVAFVVGILGRRSMTGRSRSRSWFFWGLSFSR